MSYVVDWLHETTLPPHKWVCGYCHAKTGNSKGFKTATQNKQWAIYICPSCFKPTFFDGVNDVPCEAYGKPIANLPSDIGPLYDEARSCTSVHAYTACVLTCRKILMHIAVAKGAQTGQTFQFYVNYLLSQNIAPQQSQSWVDHIRKKSNEANHEINQMTREDALTLLVFTEMLLMITYEFPNRVAPQATGS